MSVTRARTLAFAILALLALVGGASEAGSIPHAHWSAQPGLFNEDHDLTSLATLRGGAPLPEGLPTLGVVPLQIPLPLVLVARPASASCRHTDPRAPPPIL